MKEILSIEEMIKYSSENKKIIHNNKSEQFLLLNNYQNVISVYKKQFHSGKDVKGKHIYQKAIPFDMYIDAFNDERLNYRYLREKSCMFEFYFKNLVHYYFFIEYKNFCRGKGIACDEDGIITFLNNRLDSFDIEIIKHSCIQMVNSIIKNYKVAMKNGKSPFVFFSKLHLSEIRFIFLLLLKKNQSKIVRSLNENNILKIDGKNSDARLKAFTKVLDKLIGIRNVVVHNNSMEIFRHVERKNYQMKH